MRDAQGHATTNANAEAIGALDAGTRAFLTVHGDTMGLLDKARAAAPDCAMAHLTKSWVLTFANDPTLMAPARALLDAARTLPANDRERAHAAALSHVVDGARAAAVAVLDRHLMDYPRDLLAHQTAALMDGFLGRFPLVRDRSARAIADWGRDEAGYGCMLSMLGFGQEEAGDYARAEETSREAAELEPLSFWPHHSVAHVMEMTGRPQDGLGWMAAREPLWSTDAHANRVHIWWHRALFHVELGQYDAALALYDGPVRQTQRPLGVSLTNASALLWRLHAIGRDVGDRWAELAELWEGHADGKCLAFSDIHAAMAELGAGRDARFDARMAAMRATAASGAEAAGTYRDAALPICEGLAAFQRGRYAEAVEAFMRARFDLWRIGGSHAQRDIVNWTLAEAAARAGDRGVALAMARERIAARPRSAPNRRFLERAEAVAA